MSKRKKKKKKEPQMASQTRGLKTSERRVTPPWVPWGMLKARRFGPLSQGMNRPSREGHCQASKKKNAFRAPYSLQYRTLSSITRRLSQSVSQSVCCRERMGCWTFLCGAVSRCWPSEEERDQNNDSEGAAAACACTACQSAYIVLLHRPWR